MGKKLISRLYGSGCPIDHNLFGISKKLNLIFHKEHHKEPYIIAGPCSAETEEQLRATVHHIHEHVHCIRVGIWKPRTRPNSFEGIGEIGLQWIRDLKQEYAVPFCIEVASPKHIDCAMKYGIDAVWLGARTTVNPFLVQEIAASLKGLSLPVLIKNPINPDVKLWLGAIERIQKAGIKEIAALHRGFSSIQENRFRNAPLWQIPIALKQEVPQIPLLCDPSHIAGHADSIKIIAQKALDLDYDGLMIETHIEPHKAWSDAEQQITPDQLIQLLDQLEVKNPSSQNPFFNDQLELLREKIDHLDRELVEILVQRMKIVEKIGKYKKENGVTIFQLERWKTIFQTRSDWAAEMGLYEDLVAKIFELIHTASIQKQTEQINP